RLIARAISRAAVRTRCRLTRAVRADATASHSTRAAIALVARDVVDQEIAERRLPRANHRRHGLHDRVTNLNRDVERARRHVIDLERAVLSREDAERAAGDVHEDAGEVEILLTGLELAGDAAGIRRRSRNSLDALLALRPRVAFVAGVSLIAFV